MCLGSVLSCLYFVGAFFLVYLLLFFCFFKQKTAYEMRISDWSSDVCSSDLIMDGIGAASRQLSRASISISPPGHTVKYFMFRLGKRHLARTDRKSVV